MTGMQKAEQEVREAQEHRRSLQAQTIRDEAAIETAIRRERMAQYELGRYQLATMPEGTKFWSTGFISR